MTRIRFILIVFTVSIFPFLNNNAHAQNFPIKIKLEQPPPGQLNLHHLWRAKINNTSGNEMKIYLEGYAEEEKNGRIVEGQTKVFMMPKGERTYQYEDFKTGSVRWFPQKTDYKTIIERTGTAPDGVYTICMTAKNESGDIVGLENCIIQLIIIPITSEISLIAPENDTKLENTNPVFIWSPQMPAPKKRVTYSLKLVEVRTGQSLEDAVKRNTAVFEETGIITTQYKYPAKGQILKEGIKYAWMIITDNIISEVWSFTISPSEEEKKPPVVNAVNYYYDLSKEITGNYIIEYRDTLKIQFINNYASVSKIIFHIYNAETLVLINPKVKSNIKLNNINGLNRISIYLGSYNLKPDKLYLLIVSDFKSNYYMNFKVSKSYKSKQTFTREK